MKDGGYALQFGVGERVMKIMHKLTEDEIEVPPHVIVDRPWQLRLNENDLRAKLQKGRFALVLSDCFDKDKGPWKVRTADKKEFLKAELQRVKTQGDFVHAPQRKALGDAPLLVSADRNRRDKIKAVAKERAEKAKKAKLDADEIGDDL